jgi:ketosteroid isomerase-like protein
MAKVSRQAAFEEVEQVASAFFAAIERADIDAIEALYSPEVEVWINVTGKSQGRAESVKLLRAFTSRVKGLAYEIELREPIAGGFLQRHILRGELASGQKLAVPVCLVVHVEDGRISRLYEYLDSAAIAPVFDRSPTRAEEPPE